LNPENTGPLATNELGLRDSAYNADADINILVLGDSVAWGDGVLMEHTFPFLLQQNCNKLAAPKTVEVINSGVPGYSTFQQLKYFELRGRALKPDLVILQFCLNDVVERYQRLARYGGDNRFLGIDTRQSISGIRGFLFRNSKAYERFSRYLQNTSRARSEYEVRKMARNQLSEELDEAWDLVTEEIDKIRRLAADRDTPFLLMIAPYRFQLSNSKGLRQPQDRLIQYAKAHFIPCVDLLPDFVDYSSNYVLFNDENHFSLYGHQVAARALVQPVQRLLKSRHARD